MALHEAAHDVEAEARPLPTPLVVKNGSKMRSWISAWDAGAVVDDANHDAPMLAAADHLDPPGRRDRVERVVDQIQPHLIELAAKREHAREIVRRSATSTATDFSARLRSEHGEAYP